MAPGSHIPIRPPEVLWHMQSPRATRELRKKLLRNVIFGPFQTYNLLQSAESALLLRAKVSRRWASGTCGHLGLRTNQATPPQKKTLNFISVPRSYLWVVNYSWRSKSCCQRSPRNLGSNKYPLKMLFWLSLNYTIKTPLAGICGSLYRSLDILKLYIEG